MLRSRCEACSLLQRHGISCAIWFEDSVAYYGVPTVVFDLYLLVPNIQTAAKLLQEEHEWQLAPRQENDIYDFLEGSPALKVPLNYIRLIPPDWDEETEQRTVLMPADIWNFTAFSPAPDQFFPSLPALVDSLIASWLDGLQATDNQLLDHVSLQLAYVYEYVAKAKEASFTEQLRPENRQFHLDCVAGGAIGTQPFLIQQREIRDRALKG